MGNKEEGNFEPRAKLISRRYQENWPPTAKEMK
jgi:hypothetical protein